MSTPQDLSVLLRDLQPELAPEPFVFAQATVRETDQEPDHEPGGLAPFATVREDEGLTLVLPLAQAQQAGLPFDFVAARITLRVSSELTAVGLTAAVAGHLARAGIACNVIAGLHHDHLLVPWECGEEALTLLAELRDAPP